MQVDYLSCLFLYTPLAYKSYNIPGALEVAVAPREGWRIRTPSIRLARGLIPPRRRSLHKVP